MYIETFGTKTRIMLFKKHSDFNRQFERIVRLIEDGKFQPNVVELFLVQR
jgi:hypothetical protein